RLILTVGSWSKPLLESLGLFLPLTVTRQQLTFFDGGTSNLYSPMRLPVFIAWGEESFYGIPDTGGTGVKCAQHGGGAIVTPDLVSRTVDKDYIEKMRGFLRQRLPSLAEAKLTES